MKTILHRCFVCAGLGALLAFVQLPVCADQTKASTTTTDLNTGASWVGGTAPGAADVAIWNTNSDAGTLASPLLLGANVAWKGIKLDGSSGSLTNRVYIGGAAENAGNPYLISLGTTGISLLDAASPGGSAGNLDINGNLALTTNQTWSRTRVGTAAETINIRGTTTGSNLTVNVTGFSTVNFFGDCSGVAAIGLNSGTLNYYSNFPSTTINVASGAALGFNQSNSTYTAAGRITGAGRIEKRNGGTVSLAISNSFSGGTRIYGGILGFNQDALGGTGTIQFFDNGTLRWNAGNNQDISGRLTVSSNKVATLDTGGNNVTFGSALSVAINGAASLTKTGLGALTLNGADTYTNVTTVSAGRLNIGGQSSSPITVNTNAGFGGEGTGTGSVTLNDGTTLNLDGSTTTGAYTVGGDLTLNGTITLAFDVLPAAASGPINVLNYSNAISGGAGNFSLPSASNYRSSTLAVVSGTPNAITLDVGNASRTWSGTAGNWDVGSTTAWVEGDQKFFWGDAVTFNDTGLASTNVTLNGVLQPSSVVVNSSGNYVFTGGGSLAGGTALDKSGSGSLTLATASAATGGVSLNVGTLNLNHASALGTGLLAINGGQLGNTSGGPIVNAANNAQLWGSTVAFAGPYDLDLGNGAIAIFSSPTVDISAGNLIVGGGIGGGFVGLTKTGAGTLKLSGAHTYNGDTTTIANGTLAIVGPNGSLVPQPVVLGDISLNTSGRLMLGDASQSRNLTVTSLTTAGTGTSNSVVGGNASVSTLTISNVVGADVYFDGVLGGPGANQNNLGLTKRQYGQLTLGGTSTYTGPTVVYAGILALTNTASISGSSTILMNPGAIMDVSSRVDGTLTLGAGQTFASSGVLTGAVNVASGSTLSPGYVNAQVVGSCTNTGNQAWQDGGAYLFQMSGTNNTDLVIADGSLDVQATSGNKFTVKLASLTTNNTAGPVADFVATNAFEWVLATPAGGILNFAADKFAVDTTAFSNPISGTFNVTTNATSLLLTYAPQTSYVAPTLTWVSGGGNLILNFSGPNGQPYQVLTSTNVTTSIASWIPVGSGSFPPSGLASYTNSALTEPKRFYRITSP